MKWSKFGKFLGCSGFPECRNVKKLIDASKKVTGVKCPKCKEGDVIIKRTKAKKRMFYGCSRWPDCDFVSWKKPAEEGGEEATENEKKDEDSYFVEKFTKSYYLSDDIIEKKIEAEVKNGVLKINLPTTDQESTEKVVDIK